MHDDSQRRTEPVSLNGLENLRCKSKMSIDLTKKSVVAWDQIPKHIELRLAAASCSINW